MKAETQNPKSAALSPAQRIVLRGIAAGKKPNQIVDDLPSEFRVGVHGVDWHIRQIYLKFGVHSAVEAVREAALRNLL